VVRLYFTGTLFPGAVFNYCLGAVWYVIILQERRSLLCYVTRASRLGQNKHTRSQTGMERCQYFRAFGIVVARLAGAQHAVKLSFNTTIITVPTYQGPSCPPMILPAYLNSRQPVDILGRTPYLWPRHGSTGRCCTTEFGSHPLQHDHTFYICWAQISP
jgi:hypothetical protein